MYFDCPSCDEKDSIVFGKGNNRICHKCNANFDRRYITGYWDAIFKQRNHPKTESAEKSDNTTNTAIAIIGKLKERMHNSWSRCHSIIVCQCDDDGKLIYDL